MLAAMRRASSRVSRFIARFSPFASRNRRALLDQVDQEIALNRYIPSSIVLSPEIVNLKTCPLARFSPKPLHLKTVQAKSHHSVACACCLRWSTAKAGQLR
jgi:hypothetical protein